jgi:hypothetical protein
MPTTHELAEKLAGLASRMNDMAVDTTGEKSRALLALQDHLTDEALAAISLALDEDTAKFKQTVKALDAAIDLVDQETAAVEQVTRIIKLTQKAADLAEALLKSA